MTDELEKLTAFRNEIFIEFFNNYSPKDRLNGVSRVMEKYDTDDWMGQAIDWWLSTFEDSGAALPSESKSKATTTTNED